MSQDPPIAMDGTTGSLAGVSFAQNLTMAAFTGIAWYNVLELNVSIQVTFKRKTGLYFWSLLIASWGVFLHSLAFILKFYSIIPPEQYAITCTVITIGWYAMVTGQSLVLWSRLHLILKDDRILRAVLYMIVIDAIILHIPTTVLTYGSNSPYPDPFVKAFDIMEKIQMTAFSLQEFIISGVYIWATARFLKPMYVRKNYTRSVMMQLIWINVFIVALDVAMLTMEYMSKYALEAVMKGTIYSIKLKIEFAVLNQVMRLASSSRDAVLNSEPTRDRTINSVSASVSRSARRPSIAPAVIGFVKRIFPEPTSSLEEPPRGTALSPLSSTSSAKARDYTEIV